MRGRGKIDRDSETGEWSSGNRVGGKEFRHRKTRDPQQMPSSPRAIVIANDFDSHGFLYE